jgi:hypothetical protein
MRPNELYDEMFNISREMPKTQLIFTYDDVVKGFDIYDETNEQKETFEKFR